MASAYDKKKGDPKPDAAESRFVENGEGMTINGMSLEDYLKHPDTKAALAKSKAAEAPKK